MREKLSLYDPDEKPFDLSRLTAKLVARVILKHMDGNVLSMSTVGGWTSAVADFFRSYNVPTPAGYKEDVKNFVNGCNRTNERENNVVGKDALPFEVLCKMCRALLACAANDAVFAHLFLVLQWNLSNNVEKIDLEHLQWREDCLLVYFRKQKNDKDGSWIHEVFTQTQLSLKSVQFLHSGFICLCFLQLVMIENCLLETPNLHAFRNAFLRS